MKRQPEPEHRNDAAEAEAYPEVDVAAVNEAFVDRLMERTAELSDAEIDAVDLGSGPGDIPIRVARRRAHWRIVAVGASAAMLSHARNGAIEAGVDNAIRWELADAEATHLPDATFHVVFSHGILHHVHEPQPFWGEVKRISAPGAVWLFRDLARPPDKRAALEIVQTYASQESQLLQEEFYRSLLSAYTVAEVRRQLRRAGLRGLEVSMVTDRHLDVFGRAG